MYILKFLQRHKELLNSFKIGKDLHLDESKISVRSFEFQSRSLDPFASATDDPLYPDQAIHENKHFNYQVFYPSGTKKWDDLILLLHGLNERSWDKYLIWAEYLAVNTGKPVVLFPIAFHINRAPSFWADPRSMKVVVEKRKAETGDHNQLSFVNAALSERLSEKPLRFYSSGRQTIEDLTHLATEIRKGMHPLFKAGANIDIFSYSIGSFMSEILLMANPQKLFSNSRLFVFCGGSIFSHMYGESKCIMDRMAYNKLFHYYLNEWSGILKRAADAGKLFQDEILDAFNAMLRPENYPDGRLQFFSSMRHRLSGIALQKDRVMPWSGVEACMGSVLATQCFELLDFPYEYTHEFPFPVTGRIDDGTLNDAFSRVFQKAAAFLK